MKLLNWGKMLMKAIISGLLLGILMVVGYSIDKYHTVQKISEGVNIYPRAALVIAVIVFAVLLFICVFQNYDLPLKRTEIFCTRLGDRRLLFILWGVMLLFYIPLCKMAPLSSVTGDLYSITEMLHGKYAFGNHQPVLYALIWKLCLTVRDVIGIDGIAVYLLCLLQVLLFTFAISDCLFFMTIYLKRYILALCSFAFFLLSPLVKQFAVAMNKDTFFAAMLMLFIKCIIEMVNEKSNMNDKGFLFRLFSITGFLCLFRNNACIVILLQALVILWCYKKQAIKPCAILGIIVILFFIMVGPFFRHFEIANSPVHEKMSVPICQMSNIYNNYEQTLSEADKAQILEYMPNVSKYKDRIADYVKDSFNDVLYKSDRISFWKLWFKLLINNPLAFIDAFLNLNVYYWYPRSEFAYSECLPVLGLLILFLAIKKQRLKDMILVLLPCTVLLLTNLLGPVVLYRYIMPITVSIPLLTGAIISIGKKG